MAQNDETDVHKNETETHETFGMISFSRRTGNPGRLFGSNLPWHESFLTLKISNAERHFSLGYERFYARQSAKLIEVDISAAQFAQLITTMNAGDGTPCTIRYIDKKQTGPIPPFESESDKVKTSFRRAAKGVSQDVKKDHEKLASILEKKTLSKEDRKEIQKMFDKVDRTLTDHMPFLVDSFDEATDKLTQHAKTEFDSFVSNSLFAEGIRSLQDRLAQNTLELPPASEGNGSPKDEG